MVQRSTSTGSAPATPPDARRAGEGPSTAAAALALEQCARHLAGAAVAAGDGDWAADVRALVPVEVTVGAPPTYGQVARAGADLVVTLIDAGRWGDAERQTAHLTSFFRAAKPNLHAVAGEAFGGLTAAVRARDRDEVIESADLIHEMFAEPVA